MKKISRTAYFIEEVDLLKLTRCLMNSKEESYQPEDGGGGGSYNTQQGTHRRMN